MEMCNKYSGTDYAVTPSLFLEFHGSEKSVEDQVEKTCEFLGYLSKQNCESFFTYQALSVLPKSLERGMERVRMEIRGMERV